MNYKEDHQIVCDLIEQFRAIEPGTTGWLKVTWREEMEGVQLLMLTGIWSAIVGICSKYKNPQNRYEQNFFETYHILQNINYSDLPRGKKGIMMLDIAFCKNLRQKNAISLSRKITLMKTNYHSVVSSLS